MSVKVTWSGGMDRFKQRLEAACSAGLTAAVIVAADTAARSLGSDHGGQPSAPYSPPNSQIGNLRNGIHFVPAGRMGSPFVAAFGVGGPAVPYARILEFGGTITAKRTKFLPVPINAAAKAMLRRLAGASLRGQNLKFIRAKGKGMLVEQTRTGREKKNGAAFVLKRSIYIAPRPYLRPVLSTAGPAMMEAFRKGAQDSLRGSAA